ncbi:hypothetical protein VF04_27065 [Nostoc linckia z7]|uniref:Uncharacterized protein n=1 Tax=Nostoc linckia z7 TaxID=1628745 RepID=A0ABX4KJK9_NOSLI|nr:hypothetical protein VF04_27065 [Nostoc linckia z7]PHK36895.1 hypothetical protein VF12_20745 [Nostoc linckia z15]
MPVSSLDGNVRLTSRQNRRHLLTFGNPKAKQVCESSQPMSLQRTGSKRGVNRLQEASTLAY